MSQRFLRSLHEEHLEEISSLYERRIGLLDDTEIEHQDIADLEWRMEAHLDALVVGGDPALELCTERALEGDPGELFGALCVYFRQGRQDLFEAALARFEEEQEPPPPAQADEDDDEQVPIDELIARAVADLEQTPKAPPEEDPFANEDDEGGDEDEDAGEGEDEELGPDGPTPEQALGDALCAEGPLSWQPLLERLLDEGKPPVVAAIARMMAARGLRVGPKLVAAAARLQPGAVLTTVLWALGRARERSAAPLLADWTRKLDHEQAGVAALALLRFGDPSVFDFVIRVTPTHPWAISLLAITGGPAMAPMLEARLSRPDATADDVIAAGLFGEPAMVPRLLELLEKLPEVAAQALYLITGASIIETVTQTVEGADENETLANGQPDPRNQIEIERLALDPAPWRQWWSAHGGRLAPGKRHRLGELASPEVLGQTLHRFVLRRPVRQLAAEEIGLRYSPPRDLDVDQWAGPQRSALAGLSSLRQSNAVIARADGAWVFAQALQR